MNMGSTPRKTGTMRATGDVSFAKLTSTDVSVLFPIVEDWRGPAYKRAYMGVILG